MQIINKMVQCSECGCIAFPDALYCPKCGASYRKNKTQMENEQAFKKCSIPSIVVDARQLSAEACYQVSCPRQGQIGDIKTVIIMPGVNCPLCQGS